MIKNMWGGYTLKKSKGVVNNYSPETVEKHGGHEIFWRT